MSLSYNGNVREMRYTKPAISTAAPHAILFHLIIFKPSKLPNGMRLNNARLELTDIPMIAIVAKNWNVC